MPERRFARAPVHLPGMTRESSGRRSAHRFYHRAEQVSIIRPGRCADRRYAPTIPNRSAQCHVERSRGLHQANHSADYPVSHKASYSASDQASNPTSHRTGLLPNHQEIHSSCRLASHSSCDSVTHWVIRWTGHFPGHAASQPLSHSAGNSSGESISDPGGHWGSDLRGATPSTATYKLT
jgi:hypothetical protein